MKKKEFSGASPLKRLVVYRLSNAERKKLEESGLLREVSIHEMGKDERLAAASVSEVLRKEDIEFIDITAEEFLRINSSEAGTIH